MRKDDQTERATMPNTDTQTAPYATAEEFLADVAEREHDLLLGKLKIRVSIPVSYTEIFEFDQRAAAWVKEVKSLECPKPLSSLMKRPEHELAAIFTVSEACVQPKLTYLQVAEAMKDGIKIKAIIRSMESLRVQHLQAKAVEAIEEGKDE